jgi:hypothetical protein
MSCHQSGDSPGASTEGAGKTPRRHIKQTVRLLFAIGPPFTIKLHAMADMAILDAGPPRSRLTCGQWRSTG